MVWSLQLPSEYPYVLLAASSIFFVNSYHVVLTSSARKKSGIKYPIAYATEEQAAKNPDVLAFNCTQRAHANFTENLTPFLGQLLISGLRYPVASAGFGAAWIVARVLYATGYSTGKPEGRRIGAGLSFLADTPMKFLTLYTSVMFVLGR